jgi:sulfatase maturation enzyme AslB (radical SAM superfamily)
MIAGKELPDCSFCYEHESIGLESLRQKVNKQFPVEHIVAQTKEDGTLDVPPSYFDYRTITCNLQCTTCDDNHSSKHVPLVKELLGRNTNHRVDANFEKQLGEEIMQGLRDKTVNSIYWAGGEPMLMRMHWNVIEEMERLYEDPEYNSYIKDIVLFYNTNMTTLYWKNRLIPEILSKFNVTLWASIDGVEETFEYCRDGAKWQQVKDNWLLHKQYIPKTAVTAVISAPVLMDIDRFMDFFEQHGSSMFNHPYLPNDYKNLLDIRLYPKELFDKIINHAMERISRSDLPGKDYTLSLLQMYIKERFEDVDYSDIKRQIIRRDKFLKNAVSFEKVLEHLDHEVSEWYKSIVVD